MNRDVLKMKLANDHNISFIRILQNDVKRNKFDWKDFLMKRIKKYETVTNIFWGMYKEYTKHKEALLLLQ